MKKFLGFTLAVALLVPVGLMVAAPGGAAAAGTSCKPPAGKITLKPGLSNTPTVQTISINLPLTGCTGVVKSGTIVGSVKTAKITISSFLTTTTPTKLAATITWNTKATSTFVAATTVKVGKGKITATIAGKISLGLFKGLTASSTTSVTPGPTVGGKETSATIKGLTPLTIK